MKVQKAMFTVECEVTKTVALHEFMRPKEVEVTITTPEDLEARGISSFRLLATEDIPRVGDQVFLFVYREVEV